MWKSYLRMTATTLIMSITPILYRYKGRGSVTTPNGSEFICKIHGAPLRFLHKLYMGSEETAYEIADLWREPLPACYRQFLTRFNGATLFDNSFHIFGLPKDFNRRLSLEDRHAFPITHVMKERRVLAQADAANVLPVASITATELFDADLRPDGSVILKDEHGNARAFASFADFVGSLCVLLDNLSDENGLHDDSCEELQREMIGFIAAAQPGDRRMV